MCPLQPCQLPTAPGVWWRDTACYQRYDAASAQRIRAAASHNTRSSGLVDLGIIKSAQHPQGMRYTVDISRMMQISANGFERNIVINEDPSHPTVRTIGGQPPLSITPPGQSAPREVNLNVFYADEQGCQVQLDPATARELIRRATRAAKALGLGSHQSEMFTVVGPSGWSFQDTYTVRVRMVDTNSSSNNVDVEIEVCGRDHQTWRSAKILASPALASQEDTRLLSICESIRCHVYNNLALWIPHGMKVQAMNPNLWDKEAPVVKNFLREACIGGNISSSPDLQLAYHGTRAQNVSSIFSRGLDPGFRRSAGGAYLASQSNTAMGYATRHGSFGALLLFVLVSVASRAVQNNVNGIFVVPEQIALPIAHLAN